MRRGFYSRLAATNIVKNKRTYIPYMLTSIGCIAMLYMMFFILQNEGMDTIPGGSHLQTIVSLGVAVICIFSFIFLLYSNSFLMKRRQKEIGLYNILGMEKGHIARMLFRETVYTSVISFIGGILVGILGSKLALLLLLKLAHMPAQFGFFVSILGIAASFFVFGGIFFLTLLLNLRRVHLSQPVELLRGSNVGEKEPKAKWFIALLGFICLGIGYYLAITTESPLQALGNFFIAVLLVMAGTYLVFTAGSIAVLKVMRWKKSFYYKTKNFTSISGMIYRMKQNAVGLASICILSTGVLLMLSTTVSLNFGMEDLMQTRYPYDVNFSFRNITLEEGEDIRNQVRKEAEELQIPYEQLVDEMTLTVSCIYEDNKIIFKNPEDIGDIQVDVVTVIPVSEYERIHGKDPGLSDGEILAFRERGNMGGELKIMDELFQVKEWLKEWPLQVDEIDLFGNAAIVVTKADYDKIYKLQREVYGEYASTMKYQFGMDVQGTKDEQITYAHKLIDPIMDYVHTKYKDGMKSGAAGISVEIRQEEYETFYSMNGGLLFLGIFLGGLFLMGAAMIIYYKQISEGYEDKERFEIMQKVGMSRKEVKSSIRRQILMVFFVPLLMAVLHIAMAFPLISRLLKLMSMANTHLFMICTVVTILFFAAAYAVIYSITARSYYKIVERVA
ncbi:ABC transporter permease [Blautia schinkii]|nr:ABC transporter permease [Blautia schinkii]